ncbi:hypothetical protein BDQ17DRAFT_1330734 [Cyathus striatus]|nr:hypothetical protein BDQ17DRAFT_1330734 [Cyathus striatus]
MSAVLFPRHLVIMSDLWTSRGPECRKPFVPMMGGINFINNRLLQSPTHLANINFKSNVGWDYINQSHVVLLKLPNPPRTINNRKPIAYLSAVMKIAEEDFNFYSTTCFSSDSKYASDFSELELSLSGTCPDLEPFKTDYRRVTNNVAWLLSLANSKTFSTQEGFRFGPMNNPRLNFTHKLFKPYSLDNRADSSPVIWPAVTDYARNTLAQLSATHAIVRPRIYDMHGYAVQPELYKNDS